MEKVKGILFDMDGVLVNSESAMAVAACKGLREIGCNAVSEDFLPFVGMGEDKYIGGVAAKYGMTYNTSIKTRIYDIYDEIIADNIEVYDNVVATLTELNSRGYRMAVCSSADLRKVKINLKCANIPVSTFDVILSGESVANKKPAPDIFLLGASSLGLTNCECVVIEDAISGVKAGIAAQSRVIAITTSFSSEQLKSAGASVTINQLSELLELL